MTPAAREALALLRSPDHFQWYLVPLLAVVLYVYVVEIEARRWHVVLAGLIYAAAEFSWEIFNALILHFTGYSALWVTPGDTAYLILAGLTIEIYLMFCVAGVVVCKSLPADRSARVLGLPSRLVVPMIWGLIGVAVEVALNRWGALAWDYSFWGFPNCGLLILGYCMPFLLLAWAYDRLSLRAKGIALAAFLVLDITCWGVFVSWLNWI